MIKKFNDFSIKLIKEEEEWFGEEEFGEGPEGPEEEDDGVHEPDREIDVTYYSIIIEKGRPFLRLVTDNDGVFYSSINQK